MRFTFNFKHTFSDIDKYKIVYALEHYYQTNQKFNCMMTTTYDTIIIVKNTHQCVEGFQHFNINLSRSNPDGSYTKSPSIHCYWDIHACEPRIYRMTMMVEI